MKSSCMFLNLPDTDSKKFVFYFTIANAHLCFSSLVWNTRCGCSEAK
jgi:hypothetical protein